MYLVKLSRPRVLYNVTAKLRTINEQSEQKQDL